MRDITRPGITCQIRYHAGPQRIGFDVAHDGQQMLILFDNGAFETALPNMPRRAMVLVVMPGVCQRERLQNPTDILAWPGLEHQMKMVTDEAESKQPEGIALLGLRQRLEECQEIPGLEENGAAVIAAIECVIDQVVRDEAGSSSHEGRLAVSTVNGKRKKNCSEITVLK